MSGKIIGFITTGCIVTLLVGYCFYSSVKKSSLDMQLLEASSFSKQFYADFSADKYKSMEEAVSRHNEYKSIKTLQVDNEPIINNVDLVTNSFTIKIDGKKRMVVFSIGNHDNDEFEAPMSSISSLSPIIYKVTSKPTNNPVVREILVRDVLSISEVIEQIETIIRKDGIRIDTVFMDLRNNEWDVMKELVPRFCLMVRQYIVHTSSSLSPAFKNVKEMKEMYRQNGYTYSRIGNNPNIRVFMKE